MDIPQLGLLRRRVHVARKSSLLGCDGVVHRCRCREVKHDYYHSDRIDLNRPIPIGLHPSRYITNGFISNNGRVGRYPIMAYEDA